MHWLLLLADGEQGGPPGIMGNMMLPLFIVMIVMIVMSFRTSARQKKEAQNLLAKLKKNDKVVTSAGIIGVVVSIKEGEDEVTLRVDDSTNTRMRIVRSTIVRVTSDDQQPAGAPEIKTS